MRVAFFDEFGHSGPFIARSDPHYKQSPVFGLAGYLMPHQSVRPFATSFLQLKKNLLATELQKNGHHPATWEKKGRELITTKNMKKYAHLREGIFRLLNNLDRLGGRIIYCGRVKYMLPQDANAGGLYTTVMSHTIRACDRFCCDNSDLFMMILDQHSDRIKLLEAAAKTMFSANSPARCLIEPHFRSKVTFIKPFKLLIG